MKCGARLKATPRQVGKVFPCPKCGADVAVPRSETTRPPRTPADDSAMEQLVSHALDSRSAYTEPPTVGGNVRCPECGELIVWSPELTGQIRPCPHCGHWFEMPGAAVVHVTGHPSPPKEMEEAAPRLPNWNTKYCHYCAQPIASVAEMCPECGVRQHDVPTGATPSSSRVSRDRTGKPAPLTPLLWIGVAVIVGVFIVSGIRRGNSTRDTRNDKYLEIAGRFEETADYVDSGATLGGLRSRHQRIGSAWPLSGGDLDELMTRTARGIPPRNRQEEADRHVATGQVVLFVAIACLEGGRLPDPHKTATDLRSVARDLRSCRN